jgi:5-methylcytosine-specific restriction endonuclease McrA
MKRGGPLKRGAPMARKQPLRNRKANGGSMGIATVRQIAPVRKRTSDQSADWATLRRWVFERDGGRCVRCGDSLAEGFECHHRRLRSQLGQDVLSNLIALCSDCHGWAHGNRTEAQLRGWIVVSGMGPLAMPVVYWDGTRRLLCDDGSYSLAA